MLQQETFVRSDQWQNTLSTFDPSNEQKKAVQVLLQRPWFRRIWILQEVANAKCGEVVCGRKSVSAQTFATAPEIFEIEPEPHVQAVLDIMPGPQRKLSWFADRPNLWTLLNKFCLSKASQPRDRIFAILGISSDASSNKALRPDYAKPEEQMVRETISFLLSVPKLDLSACDFLEWDVDTFFQQLKCLRLQVFRAAWNLGKEVAYAMLQEERNSAIEFSANEHDVVVFWAIEKDKLDFIKSYVDGEITFSWHHFKVAWDTKQSMVEDMMKMNLGGRSALDSPFGNDMPIISRATNLGHYDLLQRLLQDEKVEVDAKDRMGRTALSYAASWRGPDDTLSTPCAGNSLGTLVGSLIGEGKVDKDDGKSVKMPQRSTCRNFGCHMVEMLLATNKVDADSKDIYGRTPLSFASAIGANHVVELLLATNKTNPDSIDIYGRTPLSFASQRGVQHVVKLLLATNRVDVTLRDSFNWSPLDHAVIFRQWHVFHLLLETNRYHLNDIDRAIANALAVGQEFRRDPENEMLSKFVAYRDKLKNDSKHAGLQMSDVLTNEGGNEKEVAKNEE
jgi:ankyrin repeat protein